MPCTGVRNVTQDEASRLRPERSVEECVRKSDEMIAQSQALLQRLRKAGALHEPPVEPELPAPGR